MPNGPPKKIWLHLEKKAKRFPEEASSRGRLQLRKFLAGGALAVALFAVYPLLVREREAPASDGAAKVTECDRIAAHPSDTQKLAPGVDHEHMDIAKAQKACALALKKHPGDGRILYQLARPYFYAKDYGSALSLLRQSAAAGYAQGQFVLGLTLIQGDGTPPDACEGGRLWVKAARQRHLYSKIYLGENWLDGLFKDCRLDLTDAEITQMISAADELVESQKQKDDLAQLKTNWVKH